MATVVNANIGTARDYSTPQLWEDAMPASLVTADEVWVGHLYAEGAGTNGEWFATSTVLTISAHTTDATRYIELRAAAGEGFADHVNALTNALLYNTALGVAIRSSDGYIPTINVGSNYVRLVGLQIAAGDDTSSSAVQPNATSNGRIDGCILWARRIWPMSLAPTNWLLVNNLIKVRGTGNVIHTIGSGAGNRFEYCTIIGSGTATTCGQMAYNPLAVENCAIFDFTTTGFTTTAGGTLTGGFNCTDLASAPGSSNQVSKTFASQFVSTTTDFRAAASGSDLVNGTPATSYATDDIIGTARDATTPTIGAWEVAAAGGGSVFPHYAYAQQ